MLSSGRKTEEIVRTAPEYCSTTSHSCLLISKNKHIQKVLDTLGIKRPSIEKHAIDIFSLYFFVFDWLSFTYSN